MILSELSSTSTNSRLNFIDWTRGLLIILMALDHTCLYWYKDRIKDEGLEGFYPVIQSLSQFFTRFVTHPCAPGFFFIAGLMMHYTMTRRRGKGQSSKSITLGFMIRGLILIGLDFILINRLGFTFGILACIGLSMIFWSSLRFLPNSAIFILSSLFIVAPPFLKFTDPSWFVHVLSEPVRLTSKTAILYPLIPWAGVMGLGISFGKFIHSKKLSQVLITLGLTLIILFIPIRFLTGELYGDLSQFWLMSKYPPSLSFIVWNLGITFLMMAGLIKWECHLPGKILNVLAIYGKLPLFFYIAHRYLYGLIPNLTHTRGQYSLIFTYGVWAGGLFILYTLCQGYARLAIFLDKKRQCL